jgi:hypothetical protein
VSKSDDVMLQPTMAVVARRDLLWKIIVKVLYIVYELQKVSWLVIAAVYRQDDVN